MRFTAYLSRSSSVTTGYGANEKPPGTNTMWLATSLVASRYFLIRAGDIASDSPELSKPAWLAGSTGNSFVGRMSTPVKSRMV